MSGFMVKKLTEQALLPERATPYSAGYDLFYTNSTTPLVIPSRSRKLVPTDISIRVPEGTYGRIASRSGLSYKHGIEVGAGVIDRDYNGPVGVVMHNHGDKDFVINFGDRIAQLILEKINFELPVLCEELPPVNSTRNNGGFGSTGK